MPLGRAGFLVGALAISALPPLNGFVSEWLLFQAFLSRPMLPQSFVSMLVPIVAAVLALAGGARRHVLRQGLRHRLPRPAARARARATPRDAGGCERVGMAVARARLRRCSGCCRSFMIGAARTRSAALLIGRGSPRARSATGWLWLVPISAARELQPVSCSLVIVARRAADDPASCAASITAGCAARRRGTAAFPQQTPRMQDTAEGFGQPIRQIFEPFFRIAATSAAPVDARRAIQCKSRGPPLVLAVPADRARSPSSLSRHVGRLQQGRISRLPVYSFVTLIALLVFVAMTLRRHRLPGAAVAARGAARAALLWLGQSVPRLAAEQERRRHAAAVPRCCASCFTRMR